MIDILYALMSAALVIVFGSVALVLVVRLVLEGFARVMDFLADLL